MYPASNTGASDMTPRKKEGADTHRTRVQMVCATRVQLYYYYRAPVLRLARSTTRTRDTRLPAHQEWPSHVPNLIEPLLGGFEVPAFAPGLPQPN
eukprot:522053-Rhodomonas_salina.1